MKQAEIINIGRDLILKAGLLKKPTEIQKEKFLQLLDHYQEVLKSDTSKYKNIILVFIEDIRDDIKNNREINIDSIQDDEYIENFFITKHEIDNFNKLIDEESYAIIFKELKKKTYSKKIVDEAVKKIDTQFQMHFKKLNKKKIAKNLLIFTTFERKLPIPALNRLIAFMKQHDPLGSDVLVINKLERAYKNFLRDFYHECGDCLKKKDINYKFIKYLKDPESKKLSMSLKCEDASNLGLRSGNPLFEYRELLKKMW